MRKVLLLSVGMLFWGISSVAEDGDEAILLPKPPVNTFLSASSLLPESMQIGDYSETMDDNYWAFRSKWFKGFLDLGVLAETRFKIGSKNDDKFERMELSTSCGYMFNPRIYLGAGIGFHLYPSEEEDEEPDFSLTEIPLFIHFRSHAADRDISPFVDLKLGYFVHAIYGLYFNPSVGCRFHVDDFMGFNVSLGFSINRIRKSIYGLPARSESVAIKIGIDF